MATTHHWTFEEDYLCCKEFIVAYVLQKSNMPLSDFVRMLSAKIPELKPGSLRIKTQNIKQLAIEYGIENSLKASPRSNYSTQNNEALLFLLNYILGVHI